MVDCRKPSLVQQEIPFYLYQTPVWLLGFPSIPSYALDACSTRGILIVAQYFHCAYMHLLHYSTLNIYNFQAKLFLVIISRVGPLAFYYISISGGRKVRPVMG